MGNRHQESTHGVGTENRHRESATGVTPHGAMRDHAAEFGNINKSLNSSLAVVAYLVKGSEKELRDLYNSLAHLSANFCKQLNMGLHYPVLLFSDGCIDHMTRGLLNTVAKGCQLRFETVRESFKKIPDFVSPRIADNFHKHGPGNRGLGYGLMIRWHMRTLFEHPAVQSVQFIFRMDTDSSILTPMSFDPFKMMVTQKPRKRYAYFCSSFESAEFRHGLHEFVANYMWQNNVMSAWENFQPIEGEPVVMPYNNIEIIDVEWWSSKPVQHFVEAVDRSLGIWHHRWGDAPIRGMAISLFLREEELLHLQNFRYSHPWRRELEPVRFLHVNKSVEQDARSKDPRNAGTFDGICRTIAPLATQTNFKFQGPDCTLYVKSESQSLEFFKELQDVAKKSVFELGW